MANPEPLKDPDGKPLDPAAQAVVDKVRRMSMLSGIATVLGISVVIVMIGRCMIRLHGFDVVIVGVRRVMMVMPVIMVVMSVSVSGLLIRRRERKP